MSQCAHGTMDIWGDGRSAMGEENWQPDLNQGTSV